MGAGRENAKLLLPIPIFHKWLQSNGIEVCGSGGGGGGGLVVAKAISFQLKSSHTFHLESKEIERGRDDGECWKSGGSVLSGPL